MPERSSWEKAKYPLQILAIALAYFATAKFGLSFAFGVKQVTLFWPPAGIAIASLLLFGYKLWPGILIGAFISNITTLETFQVASSIAIGNTLEALAGFFLLKWVKFDKEFHHTIDIVKFIFFSGVAATLVAATIGTTALGFGGTIGWSNFWPTWLIWWLGDTTGVVIFGPLILSWTNYQNLRLNITRIIKAAVLIGTTTLSSLFIFAGYFSQSFIYYPIRYAVFPFMIWGALDFGVPGATWVTLIVSLASILGYRNGISPYLIGLNAELGLIFLQLSTAIFGMTSLVLAALTEEGRKFQDDLEFINSDLEKYRLAVKSASEHIIITDKDAKILYANPAATKITGYSLEEMIGKTPALWGGQMPKSFYQKLWKTIKVDKQTFNALIVNRRKSGEPYDAEVSLSPILNKRGEPQFFVGIERDVTEHKKLDKIRSDFVSMAAHELRSPLSTIRWYTEALLGLRDHDKEKETGYISQIYSSAIRMTSLVSLLLNVSKVELGTVTDEPQKVNVGIVITDVIQNLMPEIKRKKIRFSQKFTPDTIEAFIDPNLLSIIIENLLTNAVKYTPDLGKIEVLATQPDDRLEIQVSDTGIGIPNSQKDKIFTKLFRADNVKRAFPDGTGLGLYLVKSIIDKQKGEIGFESKEGRGTTFRVSLPLKTKANG